MSDFSGLPKIVLVLTRAVCLLVAGLLAVIIAALLWARHGAEGFAFEPSDKGTLGLVAFLLLVALGLAWAMGRELRRMTGP
ncbi:MAG: hypothetical protein KGO53_12915 [Alphaproteobacteria bacterium]|nr:hypothetical protein [Alphaproteobacteria bacterium]